MSIVRILSTILFCGISMISFAQNKQIERGNKLYQQRKYAAAIPHFETGLAQKHSLSALSKLANCYRLNNKTQKAFELYDQIVKEERANPRNFYYYAECLQTLGRLEEAKQWYAHYYEQSKDEKGSMMLASLDKLDDIEPLFKEEVEVLPFAHNSPFDEFAPVMYDGGIVFTTDRHVGKMPIKVKSKWTNREYLKLAYSEQLGLIEYREPQPFSGKINKIDRNTSNTTFSGDGATLIYCQNDWEANVKYFYPLQLYMRQLKKENGGWGPAEKVPFVSDKHNYMHPWLSNNGRQLFFVSDKGNGVGGSDIYMSQRIGKDEWSRPKNLGPNINTPGHEGFPFLFEGRLFFSSKGHTSYGGYDIFYSEIDENGEWGPAINVGAPINSPYDDISIFINKAQQQVMFTSSRVDESDDIFLFRYTQELFPEEFLEAKNNQRMRKKN